MSEDNEVLCNINKRVIKLFGSVNEENSRKVVHALMEMENKEYRDDIDFYINSYGGGAYNALSIYDVIQNLKCKVNTIGIGKCMSAGSLLLMSGTGVRKAYKNTRIMIHGMQCYYPRQSLVDNDILHQENQKVSDRIIEIKARHTGQSLEKMEEDMKRDLYLGVGEALEYGEKGIIDEVI